MEQEEEEEKEGARLREGRSSPVAPSKSSEKTINESS